MSALKGVFGKKPFTELDIAQALKTSPSNAHYIRFKLISNQEIIRIARGLYTFKDKKQDTTIKKDSFLDMLVPCLIALNKQFKFTAHSILQPYLPGLFSQLGIKSNARINSKLNLHLLYVEKDSSKLFYDVLESMQTRFTVLINPSVKDLELLIRKASLENFIIIKEKNYFYSCYENKASIEAAFVDFYFEITRKKLPVYDENDVEGNNILTQTYVQLQTNGLINISTLQRYAKERKLKEEIIQFHQRHEKTIKLLLGDTS